MSRVHQLRRSGLPMQAIHADIEGNLVRLHHDDDALEAMRAAIAAARGEVLLEMYWFASDHKGHLFAEALEEAVARGCRVRVVYDAVGSLGSDGAMFDRLRAAGCEVLEYHPIAPWRTRFRWTQIGRRNHRKLLVVDGTLAILGGVNIADPWAARAEGGGGWRDDMVSVRGPAAAKVRTIFKRSWGAMAAQETGVQDEQLGEVHLEEEEGAEAGRARVRVLGNHYRDERKGIRQAYLQQIQGARRQVLIANPYFVPDRAIRRALAAAVRRGVDVRVLVPGESDIPIVRWASRAFYDELLHAGVQIYEWQGSVLHTKTAVVDDEWATIGTFNLDARSIRYNLEINAMIIDAGLAHGMRRRFLHDLESAIQVTVPVWRQRPLLERLLEWFLARFAGWL